MERMEHSARPYKERGKLTEIHGSKWTNNFLLDASRTSYFFAKLIFIAVVGVILNPCRASLAAADCISLVSVGRFVRNRIWLGGALSTPPCPPTPPPPPVLGFFDFFLVSPGAFFGLS